MMALQCMECANFRHDWTCRAFPKGIPVEIRTGEHDHEEPFPGDQGIRFEPIEGLVRVELDDDESEG